MKKALALILTLIMVLGLMPAAMAATAPVEGEVTITKSLVSDTPDEDGNYTIKLTVQGNPVTQSAKPNADVVLVVDCSGSMAPEEGLTYGECGSTEFEAIKIGRHYYYVCKKCGDWYKERPTKCTNKVLQSTTGVDRMSIAKQASKIFAEGILTDGSGNKMAVIGFAGYDYNGGANDSSAIKVSSKGLTDNLNTIKSKIDEMSADGGTNYTAALQEAQNILNGRQDKNRPGYVIFISDGAPGAQGESQGNPAWDGSEQVAALKEADITIYTIGIALDDTSANYLKGMATDEAHFKNLSDQDLSVQLAKLLAEWAGKINRVPAGTNAVMTDVINTEKFDYVEGSASTGLAVSEDKTTLTWNIGNIPEEEQSVTFKVKPKDGWTGTENTNVSCTLTYTKPDKTEGSATATSPKVTIAATTGKIVVTKNVVMPVGDNTIVNGREYSFTITQEDGRDIDTKTVTIGDNNTGSVTFENVPFGNYTVTESDAGMQGYAVTTTSAPANGTVTVSATANGNITFTNTYTKNTVEANGSLTITKEFGGNSALNTENWANATGSKQLTFTIVKEGETNGTNVTLPKDGEWTDTVQLAPGTYTVTESDAEVTGYDLTVSNDKPGTSNDGKTGTVTVTDDSASTIIFTNTYEKINADLVVYKNVTGNRGNYSSKAFTFRLTLTQPTFEVAAAGNVAQAPVNGAPPEINYSSPWYRIVRQDGTKEEGSVPVGMALEFNLGNGERLELYANGDRYDYEVKETNSLGHDTTVNGNDKGTIDVEKPTSVTFTNTKNYNPPYNPPVHQDPVPPIVIPPKTGDMTIWQSILHFLGIR